MSDKVAAIVVAAGRGTRVGGGIPKQYRPVLGEPVIRRAMRLFAEHEAVDLVQPVIHPADAERFVAAATGLRILPPVQGGATRQESVHAGLEALAPYAPDLVLVHDAARPFATRQLVSRAIAAAVELYAAIPVLPVTDSTVSVTEAGEVATVLERGRLRAVQTPQAFRFSLLHDAHRRAAAAGRHDFPDDAAVAAFAGAPVRVFRGENGNMKLTTAEDFEQAECALLADIRTGSGYDVHAFGPGTAVMLGGIAIPHTHALAGHSDADVALHALTDALLGAIALGDIGAHFPPGDPQWRGAPSDRFLAFAATQVRRRGGAIAHLDLTIVCEAPRIGPYREPMRARIAEIAGLPIGRVAVKATTNERLGFLGRGEGIAALATATVRLPFGDDNA